MKQIIILISIYCFAFSSNAQEKKWDSTYRPANWKLKVEQFKSYEHASTDIMFVGNSITAGTDWMELLGRPDVRNRGISSDISFGVLDRLDEVIMGKPAKVFILIGINDISRNIPDSFIVKNYQRIIEKIKTASPSTKIYFQTLLPVNNEFTAQILSTLSTLSRFANGKSLRHPHPMQLSKLLPKPICCNNFYLFR